MRAQDCYWRRHRRTDRDVVSVCVSAEGQAKCAPPLAPLVQLRRTSRNVVSRYRSAGQECTQTCSDQNTPCREGMTAAVPLCCAPRSGLHAPGDGTCEVKALMPKLGVQGQRAVGLHGACLVVQVARQVALQVALDAPLCFRHHARLGHRRALWLLGLPTAGTQVHRLIPTDAARMEGA